MTHVVIMFFLGVVCGALGVFMAMCIWLIDTRDNVLATGRVVLHGDEYSVKPLPDNNTSDG